MKKVCTLLLALVGFTARAQVTLKISAALANTPANATIYLADTFNNWNPGSAAHALTHNPADGSYAITLPAGTGTIEYKFTRGAWAPVETTATNGQGDLYVDFLVRTLKPYIDANYRTLPDRAHTGIGGSSMGALIATYAALREPAVFGKVAAFSPAYWFAAASLFDYVRQHPARPDTRFYFVSGTTESPTILPQMQALRDSLQRGGVPAANLSFNPRADGQHAEWFWRREFPAAYSWLYAPAVPAATRPAPRPTLRAYPNPAAEELRVELPAALTTAMLEITDARGQTVLRTPVHSGQAVDVRGLARGLYLSRVVAGPATEVVKFVKE